MIRKILLDRDSQNDLVSNVARRPVAVDVQATVQACVSIATFAVLTRRQRLPSPSTVGTVDLKTQRVSQRSIPGYHVVVGSLVLLRNAPTGFQRLRLGT